MGLPPRPPPLSKKEARRASAALREWTSLVLDGAGSARLRFALYHLLLFLRLLFLGVLVTNGRFLGAAGWEPTGLDLRGSLRGEHVAKWPDFLPAKAPPNSFFFFLL